jgi:hypothetical protein
MAIGMIEFIPQDDLIIRVYIQKFRRRKDRRQSDQKTNEKDKKANSLSEVFENRRNLK